MAMTMTMAILAIILMFSIVKIFLRAIYSEFVVCIEIYSHQILVPTEPV